MKEENRARRALALGLAALLLLVLVPILLVGSCAHPFGDDLAISQFVHHAREEGTSVLGALFYTVKRYYLGWNGAYTNVALSALQPGLLGAYALATALLLGGLCLSAAALTHALLRRWLGLDRWTWLAATSALLTVTVLYQPHPRNALFFWHSAVGCTGGTALALFLAACMVRLRLGPRHPKLLFTAALLLAALVGGGNVLVATLALLLLAGYTLLCARWDRKRLWQPAIVGVVLLAGFLTSVLSPGSRIAGAQSAGLSLTRSIQMALVLTWPNTQWMLHLPLIALLIGMVPVLREIPKKTGFAFPFPGLVTAAAVFLLVEQNAQAMYVFGIDLEQQSLNSIYDLLPWLLLVTEGYWVGWFSRRRAADPPQPARGGEIKAALLVASIGLILSAPGSSAGRCVEALADGSVRTYDAGVSAWEEVLSDPEIDPVVLPQVPDYPPLLCSYIMDEVPFAYANLAAADYYGKSSVIALRPEQITPDKD